MAGKRFERSLVPFTIINKHSYHQFITWLHEAAGGRRPVDEYKVELTDVFRKHTTTIVNDEVKSIDLKNKHVVGRNRPYPYDFVIIGVGSAPEFFGIPGLEKYSLQVRSLETARHIRTRIDEQVRAYRNDHDARRLRFVIGGAGLTGIEFVGELVEWLPKLCSSLNIDPSGLEIINIEAAPTILPALSTSLQEEALRVLKESGARMMTNTKIVKVEENAVHLESGEVIEAMTIVWTGGVRAHPLLAESGFTCDRRGRAQVNEYLQSADDDHVFIVGDCAAFVQAGRPLPPTAQVATQMGDLAARNVMAQLNNQPLVSFSPKLRGTLASLGHRVGVGTIGNMQTRGTVAGFAKEMTKVKYLYELGGMRMVSREGAHLSREPLYQ